MLIFVSKKIQNHFIILFELCGENRFVKSVDFANEDKINKSNAKVFTHYQIIGLYSEDICYDLLVVNETFDFLWNVLNTKAIKVYHTITI